MAPISRNKCLIVKLHGDYMDTRIKNTKAELSSYEDSINQLLDRVFDEYGLIISGWSAGEDIALKEALQRCKTRRYTTYWTARGDLTKSAERVVQQRGAQIVKTSGADQFFQQLADKVHALQEFETPHPLSTELAVATLKKHLSDDKSILANDLVMQAANELHERLNSGAFSTNAPYSKDLFIERVQRYEALVAPTQALMTIGCYWGTPEYHKVWTRCLHRIIEPEMSQAGNTDWINLKLYPGALLFYSASFAAFVSEKFYNFAHLVSFPIYDTHFRQEVPSLLSLNIDKVFESSYGNLLNNSLGVEDIRLPHIGHLYKVLKDSMKSIMPQDKQFRKCFEQFEYLMALIYADQAEKHLITRSGVYWAPHGLFIMRRHDNYIQQRKDHPIVGQEIHTKVIASLLEVGLFEGLMSRFQNMKIETDKGLLQRWGNYIMDGR